MVGLGYYAWCRADPYLSGLGKRIGGMGEEEREALRRLRQGRCGCKLNIHQRLPKEEI